MSEWIKCSDFLPCIQEIVQVTDGYKIKEAWIWDHPDGGVYFEFVNEDGKDFIPIWWKADSNTAISQNFEENTFKPKSPQEETRKDLNKECEDLGHLNTWMPRNQSLCLRCGVITVNDIQ